MSLILTDLSVPRGGRPLIEGLSMTASAGRMLVLLGANGAGKSTLLGAIAGTVPARRGEIRFGGLDLRRMGAADLARCRAFMAQAPESPFAFCASDIVALGRLCHAGTPLVLNDAAAILAGLEAVGMRGFARRFMTTLSGGERQRIAFARVIAQMHDCSRAGTAHLLLLDEPVASLDPQHQHQVLQTLQAIARRGATVIVALHDLSLASIYGDDVMVLEQGRVLATGPVETTLTPGLVERSFGVRTGIALRPDGRAILHAIPQSGSEAA